jgi:hypothetical protein
LLTSVRPARTYTKVDDKAKRACITLAFPPSPPFSKAQSVPSAHEGAQEDIGWKSKASWTCLIILLSPRKVVVKNFSHQHLFCPEVRQLRHPFTPRIGSTAGQRTLLRRRSILWPLTSQATVLFDQGSPCREAHLPATAFSRPSLRFSMAQTELTMVGRHRRLTMDI